MGLVMSASARISQRHLPKRDFAQIERLAEMLGAVGVQVAHSGTVAGLVFDARDSRTPRRVAHARQLLAEMTFGDSWHWNGNEGMRKISSATTTREQDNE
jgi:uncharacterized protein involved in propanediol utilization